MKIEKKDNRHIRRPDWLRIKIPTGKNVNELRDLVKNRSLNTVCEDARCPNLSECWSHRTATFMILGDICTRSCGFCSVKTGRPEVLDFEEPKRVAAAVKELGLKYAVITSVNRDELENGGAEIFADTISEIRKELPECKVEVLIPDFKGVWEALYIVTDAKPDVLNHNVETINRLYPKVRPQAKYERSLELIAKAKEKGMVTKSGFMVGLGETNEEVMELMKDLRDANCDIVTIGQYLKPTKDHLPVERYVHPDEFKQFKIEGEKMGFRQVVSGALIRSSYHAEEVFKTK